MNTRDRIGAGTWTALIFGSYVLLMLAKGSHGIVG